ncbi:MAG: DNA gyrase C-terminal beta-propeller domain-containing protein, partial [Patescibacteria group bacterium]
EKVTAVQALPTKEDVGEYLVMATRLGHIKKTSRREFENIRRTGLRAITLNEGDTLEWVETSSGKDEIMIITKGGQAIRFKEKDVRGMGRVAAGVRGIRLKKGDHVVAMHVVPNLNYEVLVIAEKGWGKRTPVKEYRIQGRGGSGIKTASITGKTGPLVNAELISSDNVDHTDILIISEKGQVIRFHASEVRRLGRATQGVRLMKPDEKTGTISTFTTWTEA